MFSAKDLGSGYIKFFAVNVFLGGGGRGGGEWWWGWGGGEGRWGCGKYVNRVLSNEFQKFYL